MRQCIRGFILLTLGIAVIALSSCATCKTSYRRELTHNSKLAEAETSYRKAIHWLDKAECARSPEEAQKGFTTAESYLSDVIFKLKESGHDKGVDVTEDVYYCEKMKSETDVKIGAAEREIIKP